MPLAKIYVVKGRCAAVPGDDIDTDRIIPARFMKCVTFDGLGEFLFHDVRYDEQKRPKPHPLNDPRFAGATILLTGNNFGCGSSREHAPQAIRRAGFKAIVAEGYAEIFFGNSITLGMPCVSASRADIAAIRAIVESDPAEELAVDIVKLQLRIAGKSFPCSLRDSARQGLLEGRWDAIGDLLDGLPEVEKTAGSLDYMKAA